ncbi:MAG: hypothetical protein EOO78_37210, partial [Oxalobacteraceae bacterium]
MTIGKLRSAKVGGVLSIDSGGVVDGGEGDIDIVAADSTLFIRSTGGIGTRANAIEIQVARLDVVNDGSGDISLQESDAIAIDRLEQKGSGVLNLSTVRGAIDIGSGATRAGVAATSGAVSLYAGGSAVRIGKDIHTTGGGVTVTAEDGDITLAAGIRVAGSGDIRLVVPKGGIRADATATGWRTGSSSGFDPKLDWAMRNGYFTINQATGEIKVTGVPSYLEASNLANGTTYMRTCILPVYLLALCIGAACMPTCIHLHIHTYIRSTNIDLDMRRVHLTLTSTYLGIHTIRVRVLHIIIVRSHHPSLITSSNSLSLCATRPAHPSVSWQHPSNLPA